MIIVLLDLFESLADPLEQFFEDPFKFQVFVMNVNYGNTNTLSSS